MGSVVDSDNDDGVVGVVDAEQDAIIAAAGAVKVCEVVAQRLVSRCGLLASSPEMNSMTA